MTFAFAPAVHELLKCERQTRRYVRCWKVARRDGQIRRYTDHNAVIEVRESKAAFSLEEYSPLNAPSGESIRKVSGTGPESDSMIGFVLASGWAIEDFRIGLFRDARVDSYVVDWRYPFAGFVAHSVYWVRDTSYSGEQFQIRTQSITGKRDVKTGRYFIRRCDAELGDDRCGKDLTALGSGTQTVTAVSGFDGAHPRLAFRSTNTGEADDNWTNGQLEWLTGANALAGLASFQVKRSRQSNGFISLWLPTYYDIQVGDTYRVDPGCNKLFHVHCRGKFGNGINHRGFITMGGADKFLAAPDSPI